MTPEHLARFTQAITLTTTNPNQAYQLFKALEREGSNYSETNLLAWLIFTAPAYREKEYWVERAHTIAPTATAVVEAIDWFRQQPKIPVPPPMLLQKEAVDTLPLPKKYSYRNNADDGLTSIMRRTRQLPSPSVLPLPLVPVVQAIQPVSVIASGKINKRLQWHSWIIIGCLVLVVGILLLLILWFILM